MLIYDIRWTNRNSSFSSFYNIISCVATESNSTNDMAHLPERLPFDINV